MHIHQFCPWQDFYVYSIVIYTSYIATYYGLHLLALAEEATESKEGHFAKLKWFSIAKITILWRGLKFKRGHGAPCPPISAAYAYWVHAHTMFDGFCT